MGLPVARLLRFFVFVSGEMAVRLFWLGQLRVPTLKVYGKSKRFLVCVQLCSLGLRWLLVCVPRTLYFAAVVVSDYVKDSGSTACWLG